MRNVGKLRKRYYTFFDCDGELVYFNSCDASMLHMEMCLSGRNARLINAGKWMGLEEFNQFVDSFHGAHELTQTTE